MSYLSDEQKAFMQSSLCEAIDVFMKNYKDFKKLYGAKNSIHYFVDYINKLSTGLLENLYNILVLLPRSEGIDVEESKKEIAHLIHAILKDISDALISEGIKKYEGAEYEVK